MDKALKGFESILYSHLKEYQKAVGKVSVRKVIHKIQEKIISTAGDGVVPNHLTTVSVANDNFPISH